MEENNNTILEQLKEKELIPSALLFLFVLIPFLPRFGALDAMGFHWMCFAILNVITSFYLINKNQLVQFPISFKPLLFYCSWILLSIVSCLFAYNKIESIVVLSRMMIVLAGVYNLICILKNKRELLDILLKLLLAALLVESVYTIWMLFYNFTRYNAIDDIVYFIRFFAGNKNILAAAIAVKIPVAFYFLHKSTNKKEIASYTSILFLGVSAIIILNARATYVSVFLQSVLFVGYEILCWIKNGKVKSYLHKAITYFAVFSIAIVLWQVVFSQIEKSKKTVSYGDINKRIASIEFTQSGSSSRFVYWNEAYDFIKKNPLIGGGLGNWKIHAINYEQNYRTSFVCSKHVHNDFLEVAADSGILSALLFTLFFIAIGLSLLKSSLQFTQENSILAFMLLLMLLAFIIDSFLNFPSERPIMQSLFVVIIAISAIYFSGKEIKSISINHPLSLGLLISICFSMYISINAYYSMCLQAKVRAHTIKMSEVKSFPAIPNITEYVMPINGVQANYFYSKKDYKKAEYYLSKKGNTNPYYYYSEYVKSRILFAQRDTANAIKYATIAFKNRPADLNMFNNLAYIYQTKKDTAGINKIYSIMNACIKNPKAADNYASYFLKASNDTNYIKQFLSSKIQEFPNDTILKKTLKKLQ
jgi:O-antigen ligase